MATPVALNNHSFVSKWNDGEAWISKGKDEWVSRPDKSVKTSIKQNSDHIGQEGSRANFFLRFVEKRETRNNYNVYNFVDEVDNVFVCFSNKITNENGVELVPGYCYLIKATIKRHQENSYTKDSSGESTKENVLNRIIVWKTIGNKE